MLGYKSAVILLVCLISETSGNGNESGDGLSVKGTLDVTLLLFSGEPDPEWQITPSNPTYQKIQRLLESAKKDGFSYSTEKIPMKLGFRGFLVKAVSTTCSKAELILGHDTVELQKLILRTMPKNEESKGIRDHVLKVIEQVHSSTNATKKMLADGPPAWSAESVLSWSECVLTTNNCYNYATNVKSKREPGRKAVTAQPGRGGGQQVKKPYTIENVRLAAELDGLLTVSKQDEPQIGVPFEVPKSHFKKVGEKRYLVALFVKDVGGYSASGGYGFHWYRKDSNNGLWSHKIGKNPPTNLDYGGTPNNPNKPGITIADPRQARRKDKAYKFVCFMSVDPNNAKIN